VEKYGNTLLPDSQSVATLGDPLSRREERSATTLCEENQRSSQDDFLSAMELSLMNTDDDSTAITMKSNLKTDDARCYF